MTNTAELNRRLENLIRLGSISEVDHDAKKIRVKTGGLTTSWLPWPAEIGKNYRRWRPMRAGTQVVLACPCGDPAQAVIIQILYTSELTAPSADPDVDLIAFDDGSYIEHNAAGKTMKVHSAGTMTLSYTHLHLQGPVTQTGGDITSDAISLQNHTHTEQGDGADVSKPK